MPLGCEKSISPANPALLSGGPSLGIPQDTARPSLGFAIPAFSGTIESWGGCDIDYPWQFDLAEAMVQRRVSGRELAGAK